jgi:tripartite-type tricarboxylate transporter receptor subunit TctC
VSRNTAFVCLAVALSAAAAGAPAQNYPNRPVRFIVAQSAGGNADLVARAIAQKLGEAFGQQVVVDNRGGASGIIATELTAKAPPDGYTLLLTPSSFGVNPSLYRKLPYDPIKDLAPVTLAASAPNILVVYPPLPVRSVKDLIELARAKPRQLNFGSSGNGGSPHLAGEMFKTMAGVELTHVPYKGASAALTALIAGEIQLNFASLPSALPLVKSGRLRAVAVTSAKRSPAVPELPTVAESGLPEFETAAWQGVFVPARTPQAIITRLNREIARIVNSPEIRERMMAEGAEPVGNTPQEFARYIEREIAKWARVVKATGMRVD